MLYSNKPLHQDPHWLSYPEPTPDYAVGQNQCVCVSSWPCSFCRRKQAQRWKGEESERRTANLQRKLGIGFRRDEDERGSPWSIMHVA